MISSTSRLTSFWTTSDVVAVNWRPPFRWPSHVACWGQSLFAHRKASTRPPCLRRVPADRMLSERQSGQISLNSNLHVPPNSDVTERVTIIDWCSLIFRPMVQDYVWFG